MKQTHPVLKIYGFCIVTIMMAHKTFQWSRESMFLVSSLLDRQLQQKTNQITHGWTKAYIEYTHNLEFLLHCNVLITHIYLRIGLNLTLLWWNGWWKSTMYPKIHERIENNGYVQNQNLWDHMSTDMRTKRNLATSFTPL